MVNAPQTAAPGVSDVASVPARIDALLRKHWQDLGLVPSPQAEDGEWCRRIHLSLAGRIPTFAEVDAFLADDRRDKRRITFAVVGAYLAAALYALVGHSAGLPASKLVLESLEHHGTEVVDARPPEGLSELANRRLEVEDLSGRPPIGMAVVDLGVLEEAVAELDHGQLPRRDGRPPAARLPLGNEAGVLGLRLGTPVLTEIDPLSVQLDERQVGPTLAARAPVLRWLSHVRGSGVRVGVRITAAPGRPSAATGVSQLAIQPCFMLERVMGVEPTTFSLGSCGDPDASGTCKEVTKPGTRAWTHAWTGSRDDAHAGRVERLADELRGLSTEERQRLRELLGDPASGERS